MPDITMCMNPEDCPKSATCYRANATPEFLQSYSEFYHPGDECSVYWPDHSSSQINGYIKQLDDFWAAHRFGLKKYNEIKNRLSSLGYKVIRDRKGKHSIN